MPGLHLRFSSGAEISERRVAARIAQPPRIRATLVPNAVGCPRSCGARPTRSGPRIEPKPWTALYVPKASARPFSGARRDTRMEPATLIRAQQSPTPACNAIAMPRRAPYGRAAIPRIRNDGNSIDRPRAAYNCVDRSPRAETQRPTRGYTAIEVAWLAMYTAKISGLPRPYDTLRKIGKNP